MPPTTRGAARARIAAAAAALPHDVLARIFSFLPPGDTVLMVPRLSKALAAEAAPRVVKLRTESTALRDKARSEVYASFPVPLWALQEAWPRLTQEQQTNAAARAAFHGDLATLRWALRALPQRDDAGALYCEAAAAGGQLEALQCARALGCEWRKTTCEAAAAGGHLAVLQWTRAQEPPCPWDKWTCSAAARHGHLAVLQWLRAQQPPCPWDEWTCRDAAEGGHLAVLQWARAQQPPCPWNWPLCRFVARGAAATAEWIRAQAALDSMQI